MDVCVVMGDGVATIFGRFFLPVNYCQIKMHANTTQLRLCVDVMRMENTCFAHQPLQTRSRSRFDWNSVIIWWLVLLPIPWFATQKKACVRPFFFCLCEILLCVKTQSLTHAYTTAHTKHNGNTREKRTRWRRHRHRHADNGVDARACSRNVSVTVVNMLLWVFCTCVFVVCVRVVSCVVSCILLCVVCLCAVVRCVCCVLVIVSVVDMLPIHVAYIVLLVQWDQ